MFTRRTRLIAAIAATLLIVVSISPVAGADRFQNETPRATPVTEEGAPVTVNSRELFRLRNRVGSITAEAISFPNFLVLSNSVTNFTRMARDKGLALYTSVTIGYDVPRQTVHELLIAAALESDDILKKPAPLVLQTSLNDYHVSYELNVFTRAPERLPRIYSSLHQHIQTQFNKAGVEIMSPAFTALRDGNAITVPPDFLPDGYRPPGFRMAENDGSPTTDQRRITNDY